MARVFIEALLGDSIPYSQAGTAKQQALSICVAQAVMKHTQAGMRVDVESLAQLESMTM